MTRKQKRLSAIATVVGVVALAAGLVLTALSDSVAFFNSPSDIVARAPAADQRIRLGGLVETGSVRRGDDSRVEFRVTDTLESVPVVYAGLLPDLFREGQGVVTEGTFGSDGVFAADTVLAKHDETYMPKEVVDDLKARGLWEDGKGMVEATPASAAPPVAAMGAGS